MKKRGQFYLLSAIVIIGIIIGFSAVSTYAKKGGEIRIFDLGEELEIESANVLDYGTYPTNDADITSAGGLDNFLKDFVSNYSEYIGEDKEISFVFGNPDDDSVTKVNYEEQEHTISDISRTTVTFIDRSEEESDIETVDGKRRTKVKFKDQEYDIELKPGENFFFVISQDIGEERHITKSKGLEEGVSIEEECGNSIIDTGETCDDGASNGVSCTPAYGSSCTYCSDSCTIKTFSGSFCGNSVIDTGETCDDGESNGVSCTPAYGSSCTYCDDSCITQTVSGSSCGDGTLDTGEVCDDGASNGVACTPSYGRSCHYCDDSCITQTIIGSSCGDGTLDTGETCDDGASNGVACTPSYGSSCNYCDDSCNTQTVSGSSCGDGVVDAGEACDNGASNGATCSVNCPWEGSCSYCKSDCQTGSCTKSFSLWPLGCEPIKCN